MDGWLGQEWLAKWVSATLPEMREGADSLQLFLYRSCLIGRSSRRT